MSDSPQQRIEADVKTALKAGEKERLSTLRMLLTDINNELLKGGAVDDASFIGLVRKAIKRREEAAELYRKGERPELAEKEERERSVLSTYLPAQADEGAIRAAAEEIAAAGSLAPGAGMGPLMKELRERFGASADGATLSRVAREVLATR
ncbi:MAG TPA: GatB/YqeY domain-containing protein [Thermoanaerobaculia bacterium]|nr:GatB/YqeY domain-containing protein [Thermoanaerobaculia bacterium]